MKNWLIRALIICAAMVGTVIAVQAPAQAACPSGTVPAGHARMWDGIDCTGATNVFWNDGAFNWECEGLGTGNGYDPSWSDRITSFENPSGDYLDVWVNFSCSGGKGTLPPGTKVSNLTGGYLNNSISSYEFWNYYGQGRSVSTDIKFIPNAIDIKTGKRVTDANGNLTKYGRDKYALAA